MSNEQVIQKLIANAKNAQHVLENYKQEQVDNLVRVIGKTVYENAELLSREAVEETRMGVYEDKVAKCQGKAKAIWHSLKNKRSVGIIKEEPEKGLLYVAKPKGVVGAVTPTTNPVVTPMCNAMFAIKGRNTIIVAPHPRSKKTSAHTVQLINQQLKELGAPANLVQIIEEPSVELTQELMQAVDVVIATGGMGMVKAAYSSGKPAYGVGAGNVQVIVDRDYDYDQAAKDIITGRKFDNGIICSGEQCIIAPSEQHAEIMDKFVENGAAYFSNDDTVDKFRQVMFVDGALNGKIVGQSVEFIAKLAGVDVAPGTKVIILKARGKGDADVLCREKMCPVLITLPYDTFEEALDIAKTNLLYEGAGHSAAIHSSNHLHISQAGIKLPISRLVVNQASSTNAGGSFHNGFMPTTTLGCGSWGNNSISENLTYEHLINISRIGYFNKNAYIPSNEEIWALR
ncbi:Succinate-semialdehyde dehydrogenase (acetylating) [Sporomusa rhizae]|uniref:aldehyde dehydrogenase family protein n=1 Tax=Sporomusa rhizae TaxID=357999 RepID=UPI00352B211E